MKHMDRVEKAKQLKKGRYYVERRIVPKSGQQVSEGNEIVKALIMGECPGCGTQLIGDIDVSQEAKEMPCFNKECNYKFLYKDNSLYYL